MTGMLPLTARQSWTALQAHQKKIRELHLRTLFEDDTTRGERLTAEAVGIYLDYSKNRVTDESLQLLCRLAEESGLSAGRWEEGPVFYTAPGFSTELLTLFLATDLHAVDVRPPEDEAVERSWLTLPDALTAIDEGGVRDAKSLVGVLWLARHLAPERR